MTANHVNNQPGQESTDEEIVHTDPRQGDVEHSRADISKAETLLGYRPRVGLEEGLRAIVEGTERISPPPVADD